MDFDLEKFSYRLSVLLEEKDMKQTTLAKAIGTTNVTISRYLSASRMPRVDVVVRIARYFNVSLDYLLGFSDDRTVNQTSGNDDVDLTLFLNKLYKSSLNKKQIENVKKLLLVYKDIFLSA